MPNYIYNPALKGALLDEAIEKIPETRKPLIEGLLYENSTLLVAADGGVGKSTLLTNIIAQSSLGLPVFQALPVPRPVLSYYIPFERGSAEILERLRHVRKVIPFNTNNIRIFENSTFPSPNLYDEKDQEFLLESIERDCPDQPPDVIFYDPIYQAVAGGLSNEDKVSLFIRFNVRLMAKFKCSTWLNHHTVKSSYDMKGNKLEKDDPYYGSSYLRNHCTGSYYVKKNPETDGTVFIRKKDNLDLLLKRIVLHYEPETYTSYMEDSMPGVLKSDRIKMILRQLKSENKKFTFRQLEGCLVGVSTSYLRSQLSTPPLCHLLKVYKNIGSSSLYEVLDQI